MSKQRHARAMELFAEARELSPQIVGSFLERACGRDAALRAEVESLLAHHQPTMSNGTPDFLMKSALHAASRIPM